MARVFSDYFPEMKGADALQIDMDVDLQDIVDSSGNELLEFDEVSSAVNYLGVQNAATGGNPTLYAGGEADTGITFENSEGEEILILDSVATSVNEVTISSAAASGAPKVAATGGDTNIDLELEPKGTGKVIVDGPMVYERLTETVAATNVITAAESGSVFFLNNATEFVSTLPAAAAGLHFTFIVTGAPSGASYTIVTDSSSNIIKGQVYTLDVNSATDPDFETSGADTITFVDAKAVAGDRVDVICDGTNWFAYCFCSVFDAITITTAS